MYEQQNEIPSRTRSLKSPAFLLLLWLPLVLYTGFEWFIDPFPKSIWALRALNTKYLVHVRADLTIDGEPLVMERTFRCFEPVDYHWFPGSFEKGNVFSSNGQAGDALSGITSKGRVFVISVTDACSVLIDLEGPYRQPRPIIEHQLSLARDELDVPIVHELIGGDNLTQVDTYIVREWLLEGYHGVQVNDITVQKTAGPLFKDWDGYDWFGPLNWARVTGGRDGHFSSKFAAILPEDTWSKVGDTIQAGGATDAPIHPFIIKDVEALRIEKTPHQLGINSSFGQLYGHVNTIFSHYGLAFTKLRVPRQEELAARQVVSWFTILITPCLANTSTSDSYVCNTSRRGVISSQPQKSAVRNTINFKIDRLSLTANHSERGYYLADDPLRAIIFDEIGLGFVALK